MKILRIGGRNLASLAGDFVVDFEQEPLASSGLFAISGPTGAGKSTLLDALCVALYDATPRLVRVARGSLLPDVGADTVSAQDPRTLLRRGAAEAHAEVDFIGNDNVRYRARWSVRRSRGRVAGVLQKSTMSLHRLPELVAIGGTKTEVTAEILQRIGLTFEQFTRAVLLAQNEFSAFLKTEENERGALLETLTGSTIYSAISRRAFERFGLERATMEQLSARLADHTPLAAEARLAVEAQCALADAALHNADLAKAALEHQLRWHQEAARLARSVQQAEESTLLARAAVAEARDRRAHLDLLERVEPARALLADTRRLDAESAGALAAVGPSGDTLKSAIALHEQVGVALTAATTQLHLAQQARIDAAPQLDEAKALDASIAALAPSHAQARDALAEAKRQLAQAESELAAKTAQMAALRAAHEHGAQWLAAHAAWEGLSTQWPRWDTLLAQAVQAAQADMTITAELAAAQLALDAAAARDRQAVLDLARTTAQLAGLDRNRQASIAALAQFDAAALRQRRIAVDERRHGLSAAQRLWMELTAAEAALAAAQRQATAAAGAAALTEAALASLTSQAPALAASQAQSERSLQVAELACAQSIVDLRARLSDGEPCPVCGSAEHPYQQHNPALHDMLASLRAEVLRCRSLAQDNGNRQATACAELAGQRGQLAGAQDDAAQCSATMSRLGAELAALPVMQEAAAGNERAAWFVGALDAAKAAAAALDLDESAMRAASARRDEAQAACDRLAAQHAAEQSCAAQAAPALARAQVAHAALVEQRRRAGASIASLLAELAPAFPAMPDWQRQWNTAPAHFRAAREGEVAQWRTQSADQVQRAVALGALDVAIGAAQLQLQQAAGLHANATSTFHSASKQIDARRAQRAALWDGRAAGNIEQRFAADIANAQNAVGVQQAASHAAAQAEARARESLAQARARLAHVEQQADDAGAKLAAWMAQSGAAVTEKGQLQALLATERVWLQQERAALRAFDAALDTAVTILAERSEQRALHQQDAPATGGDVDSLAAAVEAADTERAHAHDAAGALRVQLAQDDARRASATALMADIERQQAIELRWARMNELIGSADGKKFRNYAQQFTLDVLLGYANSHLGQLAKRYRLERIAAASGPSLGLMVRDQDMGGEIRSVNSLSGGESFLVSLALALGLASLSSNRVRVESLFIDEGFGSLDSETLRVAMDALDGLQSMGRKVGVISHVQEMTERIATRILVQPSGGGTSSVTVQ